MPFTTASEEERDEIIKESLAQIPNREVQSEEGFRIVITGKGGVGKTVLAAIFAYKFVEKGFNVLAVDEDPQMNLPMALGLPDEIIKKIVPLNKQLDYIEENARWRPGIGWWLCRRHAFNDDDEIDRFG